MIIVDKKSYDKQNEMPAGCIIAVLAFAMLAMLGSVAFGILSSWH